MWNSPSQSAASAWVNGKIDRAAIQLRQSCPNRAASQYYSSRNQRAGDTCLWPVAAERPAGPTAPMQPSVK